MPKAHSIQYMCTCHLTVCTGYPRWVNSFQDCIRSSCIPRTLHNKSKAISLCLDILQPTSENFASTQKSPCLDSLCRARHKKSSKYVDHKSRSRNVPIFHMANETLRKAVTDAIDPKGKTLGLNILADSELGSHTAI